MVAKSRKRNRLTFITGTRNVTPSKESSPFRILQRVTRRCSLPTFSAPITLGEPLLSMLDNTRCAQTGLTSISRVSNLSSIYCTVRNCIAACTFETSNSDIALGKRKNLMGKKL